jgi:hypothetical protein
MRTVNAAQAPYWLGGLLEAVSVDGGPTDQQLRLLQALLRGYFGFEEPVELVPLPADELARRITDPGSRRRLVQTLAVLEFCRHPASPALAESVAATVAALGVDEPMLAVARDAALESQELVLADFERFRRDTPIEPRLIGVGDEAFAAQVEALHACPPGSLGRAFLDFRERWDLSPLSLDDPQSIKLANHDFAHILCAYQPNDAVDELALSALIVSATEGDDHFSSLTASLALYEVGLLPFPDIEPTRGVLARPGAADVFAEAMARGAACTHDPVHFDHLGVAHWPLDEVRATVGLPARTVWANR